MVINRDFNDDISAISVCFSSIACASAMLRRSDWVAIDDDCNEWRVCFNELTSLWWDNSLSWRAVLRSYHSQPWFTGLLTTNDWLTTGLLTSSCLTYANCELWWLFRLLTWFLSSWIVSRSWLAWTWYFDTSPCNCSIASDCCASWWCLESMEEVNWLIVCRWVDSRTLRWLFSIYSAHIQMIRWRVWRIISKLTRSWDNCWVKWSTCWCVRDNSSSNRLTSVKYCEEASAAAGDAAEVVSSTRAAVDSSDWSWSRSRYNLTVFETDNNEYSYNDFTALLTHSCLSSSYLNNRSRSEWVSSLSCWIMSLLAATVWRVNKCFVDKSFSSLVLAVRVVYLMSKSTE